MVFDFLLIFYFITELNSIVSDNSQFSDCMKYIKVEQNYLDKMHTAKNKSSIEQNKGNILFFLNS